MSIYGELSDKYPCEHCGKMETTEVGLDIFIAGLCREDFDKVWRGYLEAMTRHVVTDEEARTWLVAQGYAGA